jgi:hypothetical protein
MSAICLPTRVSFYRCHSWGSWRGRQVINTFLIIQGKNCTVKPGLLTLNPWPSENVCRRHVHVFIWCTHFSF